MRSVLPVCLAALVASGCTMINPQEANPECGACTMEFRTVQVQVVDTGGTPVQELEVVVRNERTGEILDVDQESGGFGAGMYAVVTDGNVDDLSETGDRLVFRATDGTLVAEGTFVVGRDRCSCHIVRETGPERLVAR
jgi:hypothetical protein